MRSFFLATVAVLFALIATPIVPASAGGWHGHHGYYHDDDATYYEAPLTVYKSYLPDEDDFGPIPRHYYVKRYVHRYHTYHEHSSGCGWLKRRAHHTGSRYWWRRYHECKDD